MADDNTSDPPSGDGPKTPRGPRTPRGSGPKKSANKDLPARIKAVEKAFSGLGSKWAAAAEKANEYTKVLKGQGTAVNNLVKTMSSRVDAVAKAQKTLNQSMISGLRSSNQYLQQQITYTNKLTVAVSNLNAAVAKRGTRNVINVAGGAGGAAPPGGSPPGASPPSGGPPGGGSMLGPDADWEHEAVKMNRAQKMLNSSRMDGGKVLDDMFKKEAKAAKEAAAIEKAQKAYAKEQAKIAHDKSFGGFLERTGESFKKINRDMRRFHYRNPVGKAGMILDNKSSKAAIGLALAGTAVSGSWRVVGEVFQLVKKIFFAQWDYIDTYVLPTTAMLNKALGATGVQLGTVKSQAMKTGSQFRALGMDFAQGAQAVTDLAVGMNAVRIDDGQLQSMLKLSEYVGLGAAQTAQLEHVFGALGGSWQELDGVMKKQAGDSEKRFGVSAQIVRKELGENTGDIVRFGRTNITSLATSIKMTKQYGVAWKDVSRDFGKAFDTFESSSDIAAKLNEAFGTQLDSISLMMEKDQGKRMMMVRNGLKQQGISYETLGFQAQNLIENTLGIEKADAALYFGSDKNMKEAQRRAKQTEANAQFDKEWSDGLRNLNRNLWNVTMDAEKFLFALGNIVSVFFGGNGNGSFKDTADVVNVMKNALREATDWAEKFAKSMDKDAGKKRFEGIKMTFDNIVSAFEKLNRMLTDLSNSKFWKLLVGDSGNKNNGNFVPAKSGLLQKASFMAMKPLSWITGGMLDPLLDLNRPTDSEGGTYDWDGSSGTTGTPKMSAKPLNDHTKSIYDDSSYDAANKSGTPKTSPDQHVTNVYLGNKLIYKGLGDSIVIGSGR